MKDKNMRDAWNKIELDDGTDQRMRKAILAKNQPKKTKKTIMVTVGLSIALALVILIPLLRQDSHSLAFQLEKSDPNVRITYTDTPKAPNAEASLVYLTEEELLADTYNDQHVAAFAGTVQSIENIEVQFWQWTEYWSILEVAITEDFRTDMEPGTVVTVRVPGAIGVEGSSNSIMDNASLLTVGANVIMTPIEYNSDSTYTMDGVTLYLEEVADYGLMDGIRYLFIETPEGLVFHEESYPSLVQANDLGDVATNLISIQSENQDSILADVGSNDVVALEPKREIAWVTESEQMYMDDPGVLKNLFNPDRNVIVRATITKSNTESDAVFLQELLDAYSYTPITPMKIQINEVILGDLEPAIDTIYVEGGTISLQELYLNLPEGTVDKMGLNDFSEEERLTQYARYEADAEFTYETGKEYILVISISPGFPNRVVGNGYGTYIQDNQGTDSFQNAVSKRDFTSEFEALKESLNR